MYGSDICMRAQKIGKKSYAISAFASITPYSTSSSPGSFTIVYRHLKRTWREFLPIQTTCVRVTRFDGSMLRRRAQESYLKYIRRKEMAASRVADVKRLLQTVNEAQQRSSASPDLSPGQSTVAGKGGASGVPALTIAKKNE